MAEGLLIILGTLKPVLQPSLWRSKYTFFFCISSAWSSRSLSPSLTSIWWISFHMPNFQLFSAKKTHFSSAFPSTYAPLPELPSPANNAAVNCQAQVQSQIQLFFLLDWFKVSNWSPAQHSASQWSWSKLQEASLIFGLPAVARIKLFLGFITAGRNFSTFLIWFLLSYYSSQTPLVDVIFKLTLPTIAAVKKASILKMISE